MDKVAKYKAAVRTLVEDIYKMIPSDEAIETQLIIDKERGHFLLFSVGWENGHWEYGSFVHIDVKSDGKVWIQHNGTDLKLGDELESKGIPKSDIVIGFHSPHSRALTKYAVG